MKKVMNVVLLLVVLGVIGSVPAATLVHQWSFEDNTLDTSGSGNDGTVNGGTAAYLPGQFGQAIDLTAGVSVDAAAGATANLPTLGSDSWSMNMWLNTDATPASLSNLAGFSAREDASGNGGENEGGTRRGFLAFGGTTGSDLYFWGLNWGLNGDVSFAGTPYAADSQWHMYTMTFDGTTLTAYVDGVAIGTGAPELTDTINDSIFVGGTSLWGSTFAGSFDEFTIWNGALNQSSVTGLYENNAVPEPATMALLGLGSLTLLRRKRS